MEEREIRALDLVVMVLLNARERTEEGVTALFAEADAGFEFVRTWKVLGGVV